MSEVAAQTKPIIETAGDVGSKQDVLDFSSLPKIPPSPQCGFIPATEHIATLPHTGNIRALAFSPDSSWIVVGCAVDDQS